MTVHEAKTENKTKRRREKQRRNNKRLLIIKVWSGEITIVFFVVKEIFHLPELFTRGLRDFLTYERSSRALTIERRKSYREALRSQIFFLINSLLIEGDYTNTRQCTLRDTKSRFILARLRKAGMHGAHFLKHKLPESRKFLFLESLNGFCRRHVCLAVVFFISSILIREKVLLELCLCARFGWNNGALGLDVMCKKEIFETGYETL